jgi:hypothetical protein
MLSVSEARKNWQQRKSEWRALASALAAGQKPESWYKTKFRPQSKEFYVRRYTRKECAEEVARRNPGPWRDYLRFTRSRFRRQLAAYQKALQFWRRCGPKMRKDLLRCLRHSNRIPVLSQAAQAHPDYLVRFRTKSQERPTYGFVEVKGPRESLRPTQRRFFPELVAKVGQRVWVARVENSKNIRFARFNSKGQLEPCCLPGSRSSQSSSCAKGSAPN